MEPHIFNAHFSCLYEVTLRRYFLYLREVTLEYIPYPSVVTLDEYLLCP